MQRTISSAVFAVAVLCCGVGGVSAAQGALVDATRPDEILNIARGHGSAVLETDSGGDPKITGRIEGTAYTLLFYSCTDGKDCRDIQFNAAWAAPGISLDAINTWNKTRRYGKAFLDDESDPVLQFSVNLDHGVSRENLDDTFMWWSRVLAAFKTEVLKQ